MRGWFGTRLGLQGRRAGFGATLAVVGLAVLGLSLAVLPGSLCGAEGTIVGPDYNPYVPLPEKVGSYAGEVDNLFMLILWITGVTFVVTEGLLLYCLLMFRHRPGRKSDFVHGHHLLEIWWTVVPAVILIGLAIYQLGPWKHIKMDNLDAKGPDVVNVQVLAQQFQWNFRYAGKDGVFGKNPADKPGVDPDDLYETGKLTIPKGRKVVVEMRSTDVIHSLFLPYFRFKQDVMPGMTVHGWFEAIKTTKDGRDERNNQFFNYEIACAELCGANHYTMRAVVEILEPAEFDAWKESEAKRMQNLEIPPVWQTIKDRSDDFKAFGWDSPYAEGVIPLLPKEEGEHHEGAPKEGAAAGGEHAAP